MAKKKVVSTAPPPIASKMEPGTGADGTSGLLIGLYGPPKSEKTTACSTIPNAKWIISDPNCLPTLRALGKLPHKNNIYPVKNLQECRDVLAKALDVAEKFGAEGLGCSAFVNDSMTQLSDWHQQDVARLSGQRFMGDNPKSNGWQQFNAEMFGLIDDFAELSKYVPVICIAHAAPKMDLSKGSWAGLSLGPKVAEKFGRTAAWILYQSKRAFACDEKDASDFVRVRRNGEAFIGTEVIIHTQTVDFWTVACSSAINPETGERQLDAEEPADMYKILQKEGILE